ncbi:hypothetical protein ILT44_21310 [Microvirga sp. BT689]|uniref:hypothetical protein n=1 Tax=Microvirga arvi TaxID=2778731 RepID=UPI0019504859|nr:hypothetical protein [Microvirga arvi]MBM6582748.1 hypothetical protein [Microvirga arvi]
MASVLQGKDGHLFLDNDTNRVCDQVRGVLRLTDRQLFEIAHAHMQRGFSARATNASYAHIIVPNKETALRYLLPPEVSFQESGPTPVNSYFSSGLPTANSFFDDQYLGALHLETPCFSREDSHWNHFGAHRYLTTMLKRAGWQDIAHRIESLDLELISGKQAGDLGSKLGRDAEEIQILRPSKPAARQVFTNEVTNEGCVRIFHNPKSASNKTLFLMHDSTGLWVHHFLAEAFACVVALHYPDFDPYFVHRFKPDCVLFLQIERFFIRPPRNEVSYVEMIAAEEARKGCKKSAVSLLKDPSVITRSNDITWLGL